jgi:hypothetical protein
MEVTAYDQCCGALVQLGLPVAPSEKAGNTAATREHWPTDGSSRSDWLFVVCLRQYCTTYTSSHILRLQGVLELSLARSSGLLAQSHRVSPLLALVAH